MTRCRCGAEPTVEQKESGDEYTGKLYKYRCPNCGEKELPWLDIRHAPHEWDNIATKGNYHRRTLDYNGSGSCQSPPHKTYKWWDAKSHDHVTVKFFMDNNMYYYCFGYSYKGGGYGFNLGVGDRCYPTMETAKKIAYKKIKGSFKRLMKDHKKLTRIARELLYCAEQGELF